MKTLLILRHAKSSWKHVDLADHDRPLNKRGTRDAPRVGRLLRQIGLLPEVILSSTATRARRTAAAVAEASGYDGPMECSHAIYHAEVDDLLGVLRRLPGDCGSAMIVGHNPGCEELLQELTGQAGDFPTAALARVELDIDDWSRVVDAGHGRLVDLWRPRDLD